MQVLFLKTHVSGYTRKDGTVVAPHEDSRSRTLYHGSREHVGEIKDVGAFGGVFASGSRESAASHGDIVHRVDLPEDKVLTQHDLDYELDPDEVEHALRASMPWLDDEDYDTAYEAVIDDRSHKVDDDDLVRVFREDSVGEASWAAQRIRGAVAKQLGYQAVEMDDEHGTSYLVLPGAKIQRDADEPVAKAHPATQAMSAAAAPADLVDGEIRRNPGEPSQEQAEAVRYKKPRVEWRGLTIAIENPAGSVRRGRNRHGVSWEIRMRFDYGEIVGSMGVDGDPVDVYLGPNLDAPMVYVVHQRRVNDWANYDEDKCMVGFDSEEDARQAFLSNYTDPRFLGPITAMPVDEFVAKVRATREKPAMIKAVLFFKAHVGPYLRGGKVVNLAGYQGRAARAVATPGQLSLFGEPQHTEPTRELIAEHERLVGVLNSASHADDKPEAKKQAAELAEMKQEVKRDPRADYNAAVTSTKDGPTDDNPRRKFYVTMAREGRGVARLAGPFDRHEHALAHVDRAREEAYKVDPRSHFDAFGTAGIEADEHKPGVLNERLGIGRPA